MIPEAGDQVVIRITRTECRRRTKKAKSLPWGGYGILNGIDGVVKYDLDQMPGLREDAKKVFNQVRIGTLVTGTLAWDDRYEPILHCHGFWKLENITVIVRGDGVELFRFS